MGPRFSAAIRGDLNKIMAEEYSGIATAARDAVEGAATTLRDRLRAQVQSAGLGKGLEKAWQMKIFPKSNRQTIRPAALVYSKAQKLHDAYNTGGIIHAKNGARYLAIPTEYVPRTFSPKRKMTPVEVEAAYNQDLIFVKHPGGRPGGVLILRNVVRGKNIQKKRYKQATSRRLKQGRQTENVVMFVLVPAAKLQKKLDIEGPAEEAQNDLYNRLMGGLNG